MGGIGTPRLEVKYQRPTRGACAQSEFLSGTVEVDKQMISFLKRCGRFVSEFKGFGICHSCGRRSCFRFRKNMEKWLTDLSFLWDCSERLKNDLRLRENYFCVRCNSSVRVRMHAKAVLDYLHLASDHELLAKFKNEANFKIYEAAKHQLFKSPTFKHISSYVTSEYYDQASPGDYVDGVRHEDLERLTFPNDSFDVVITSDVLEHVADLKKVVAETLRVLKPSGVHIFTIPVDKDLPHSRERAIRLENGEIQNLREEIIHGDPNRSRGALAFRDFGMDVAEYFQKLGVHLKTISLPNIHGDSHSNVDVYLYQKTC